LDRAKATLDASIRSHKAAGINVTLTRVTSESDVALAAAGVELAKAGVVTAKAQSAAAKSKLNQAEAQLRSANAAAEEAKAQIPAAESEVTRTQNDLKRYEGVFAGGVVTPQQMDAARSAARTAQANLQAATKRLTAAEAQITEAQAGIQMANENINQSQSQVVQAESQVAQATARLNAANAAPQKIAYSESQVAVLAAQVTQAQAAARQAELNLSYTKILAPEDGRITRKSVEPGAYIQPGQPLMALVSQNVWVIANFKETQLTHMRAGQAVSIKIDAYPGTTFKGHVDSLQAGSGARFSLLPPENATGNYVKVVQRVPVKILFDEQPETKYFLGPGMSAVPEVRVR
jgi:membrane fusion protein (multidrug efflux system)